MTKKQKEVLNTVRRLTELKGYGFGGAGMSGFRCDCGWVEDESQLYPGGGHWAETCPQCGSLLRRNGPCPAKVEAVLGLPEPVTLPCGNLEGHEGPHEYRITWTDSEGRDE